MTNDKCLLDLLEEGIKYLGTSGHKALWNSIKNALEGQSVYHKGITFLTNNRALMYMDHREDEDS